MQIPKNDHLIALYIDLLKKSVSHSIWIEDEEADSPIMKIFRKISPKIFGHGHGNLRDKQEGKVWPKFAHTMIGQKRLDNIQFCVESVLADNISGDLIETGVWKGGACIFMRGILKAYGVSDRKVWVADSFEGLPKPDIHKAPEDKGDKHHSYKQLAVTLDQVKRNFESYGLLDDQVRFLKGWFKDTLPTAPIESLSVCRLDGDMYESTMDSLQALYPKLSVGGFVIIDDYGAVEGCKKAVHDYREKHSISDKLEKIDWAGIYWRKS
jgi:O-methyltransferase